MTYWLVGFIWVRMTYVFLFLEEKTALLLTSVDNDSSKNSHSLHEPGNLCLVFT